MENGVYKMALMALFVGFHSVSQNKQVSHRIFATKLPTTSLNSNISNFQL